MKCCSSYPQISSYRNFPPSVRSIRCGLKSFPMKLEICSCFSHFDCVRLSLELMLFPIPFSIFQLVILRIGIILDLLLIWLHPSSLPWYWSEKCESRRSSHSIDFVKLYQRYIIESSFIWQHPVSIFRRKYKEAF